VCIREMTDAQVLEAQGFAALLRLEEPKYSIELIAAKCGKSAGYVASRLRLTELAPAAVEAFTKDEIGLGHALLLAKLQTEQQEEALAACWQESYTNGSKRNEFCFRSGTFANGSSATFFWSLPRRRSRKKMQRLCPRRVSVSDRNVYHEKQVEEQVQFDLSGECIALGLIGQAGDSMQTGKSECQLEDRVADWRIIQKLAFDIIHRERPVVSGGIVANEDLKESTLFNDPRSKRLVGLFVVKADNCVRRSRRNLQSRRPTILLDGLMDQQVAPIQA
jgi:hypothetical protein